MIDQQFINDLNEQLVSIIPENIRSSFKDIEKNLKSVVQATLSKVDMVPRDEFDIQCKVLANTRNKVEALEKQIRDLEQHYNVK